MIARMSVEISVVEPSITGSPSKELAKLLVAQAAHKVVVVINVLVTVVVVVMPVAVADGQMIEVAVVSIGDSSWTVSVDVMVRTEHEPG